MRGPAIVGLVAVAFVGGLILGGLGPRQEVRRLQDELFQAQKRGAGLAGADIARLVTGGLPGAKGFTAQGDADAEAGALPDDPEGFNGAGGVDPFDATADRPRPAGVDDLRRSNKEEMALAQEAMGLRMEQARAALLQEVEATPEVEAAVDRAVDRMNDRLVEAAYTLNEFVELGVEPTRGELLRLGADVMGIMADGEQDLRAALGEGAADGLDPELFDPTSFLDPAVLDVVADAAADQARREGGAP